MEFVSGLAEIGAGCGVMAWATGREADFGGVSQGTGLHAGGHGGNPIGEAAEEE